MSGKRGNLMPVKKMYDAGVKVSFGTDWVTMDPWTAMRTAIIVDRIGGCGLDDMNARIALRKSTIEPAIHLGLGDRIGSLEVGKQADLIMMDLNTPRLRPVFDEPIPSLVYNANGADVDTVMVAGEILVQNKTLLKADMGELLRDAQKVATELYDAYRAGR
jgi:5-methylthioadenosine/S-adenosylhomocysteine deaminase